MIRSSPFSAALLDDLLRFVAANAATRPDAVYLRPGDVAWRLPLHRLAELGEVPWLRLWFDEAGVAGYGWFEPPTEAEVDLRADLDWSDEIGSTILDWCERQRLDHEPARPWLVGIENMTQWAEAVRRPRIVRGGHWLTVPAYETDAGRLAALQARGYRTTRHYAITYKLDLGDPAPDSRLPPGFRIRHVTAEDASERVAVHRDAWVGSSWTAERYEAIRAASAYDEELDLVVEDGDGRFAACCICWHDPVSEAGHFEPVGTRPAYRGRGLTRELLREGFRRLADRLATSTHTETPCFNHPAQALYEGSGFAPVGRRRTFIRRLPAGL